MEGKSMYVFWFGENHGQDDTVFGGKVIGKPRSNGMTHNSRIYLMRVDIDPDSYLGKKKKGITVPTEEGVIYKRAFWLEEEDTNRATDIVNDYLKDKYLEMQRKIEKFNEKYSV